MKSLNINIYVIILLLITTSCNSSDKYNDNPVPATEEELKNDLRIRECRNGASNLNGTLKYVPVYKNAISLKVKGLKLTCNITNKATIATLKDIKAKVIFKSKTGADILEKTFDIYEFIGPKATFKYKTEIKITNQQYKDISKFEWTIISVKCK